MKNKTIILVILVLLIVGLYGGYETRQNYKACDIGIDDMFCLIWHTTEFGKAMELQADIQNYIG